MEVKEGSPVIGWQKGERVKSGVKYDWKCKSCKRMNSFIKKGIWSVSGETCDYCEAIHTVDIDSDNIKY